MAKASAIAAYIIGQLGLAVLSVYVVFSGLRLWPRDEASPGVIPWIVDCGWLALFALQHSGMARSGFKQAWTHWVPPALERSIYVAASGLVTLVLPLVWQPLPGEALWQDQYWLLPISLAGAVGVALCCRSFDHLEFFGLRQVGFGRPTAEADGLRINGVYRWVRHPLMVTTLLFLWAQPTMLPELLLLNGGLTLYILIAIHLEERELVRKFGQAYEDYRRRVPALVPWKLGN